MFLQVFFVASFAYSEPEKEPAFRRIFDIAIENKVGGEVRVERLDGSAETIGKVLAAAGAINEKGYTASGWSLDSTVAACAVNAVHIRVRQGVEGKGAIFSVLPKEFFEEPEDYNSYYSSSSSIMTDIPAGSLIFGGGFSPFVGSAVEVLTDGEWGPLPSDFAPREGDTVRIRVGRLEPRIASIEFDNSVGGAVTVRYVDGAEEVVARVLRTIGGVGRFGGSLYADVGRIRANHSGVICVSVSPPGAIGGFQIIPEKHSQSPELKYVFELTQWMIVGPPTAGGESIVSTAPLFSDALRPVYFPMGEKGRTIGQMLDMFIVQVRIDGGPWERPPTVTGRVDDGLSGLSHVRILFPLEGEFLRD